MKRTDKTSNGTSFHGDEVKATVADLRRILGEPDFESNDGQDKTNFDWVMETEEGDVFTVYDWKEYRPLDENEIIDWHIGGEWRASTAKAKAEIDQAILILTF